MSNEELWELFPIILTEYQKDWERLYKLEEQQLRAIVGKDIVKSIFSPGFFLSSCNKIFKRNL